MENCWNLLREKCGGVEVTSGTGLLVAVLNGTRVAQPHRKERACSAARHLR